MQVSTSQAEGSVDTGLWVARFNQTKNKSAQQALVRHRVDDMQKQLSNLKDRKAKLVTEYKHDRISKLKYQSEMSRLIGEISSLQHSIEATRPRAVTVGVRVDKLNKLHKQANAAGGPEAREVAQSMHSVHLTGANSSTTGGGQTGSGTGATEPSAGTTRSTSVTEPSAVTEAPVPERGPDEATETGRGTESKTTAGIEKSVGRPHFCARNHRLLPRDTLFRSGCQDESANGLRRVARYTRK